MIWILFSGALFLGYASCGTEYTLELSPKTEYLPSENNPLEAEHGKMIVFVATASFAEGQTTTEVVIELLPSVIYTVFAIGEIKSYTVGTQLSTPDTSMTSSNFNDHVTRRKGPEYTDTTLKQRYDIGAVFNIGQVVSAGAGDAENQIVIEFEAFYAVVGDSDYKVGVGMQYDGGNYIWISLYSLVLHDNAGSETDDPEFNVDHGSDTNVAVLSPKTFELDMRVPRSASPLSLEVVSMNDTVEGFSIQQMEVVAVGEAYQYGTVAENILRVRDTCSSSSMLLDMGTPINKENKEPSPILAKMSINVSITIIVENEALVGSALVIGIGLNVGDSEVWVADFDYNVISGSSQPAFTTFTATAADTGPIPTGYPGTALIDLTIPRLSNNIYAIDLVTRVKSAQANALSILAITPISRGNNIACDIPLSSLSNIILGESELGSGLYVNAHLSVNISNTDIQPVPDADSDHFMFEAVVMMMPSAQKNEIFELGIDVNGVGEQTVEFTAGPAANYTDDVSYTFSLQNECWNNVHLAGSTLTFNIVIETERFTTIDNMIIEFPIPVNISEHHLKYKSAQVTSKGLNVPTVALGTLTNVNVTDWVKDSGEQDRAVVTIALVHNSGNVNDTKEDQFVVELKVTLKDVPTVLDGDTNDKVEFGVGVMVGGKKKKIWVASWGVGTKAPLAYSTTKKIQSFTLHNSTVDVSDLTVQWSDDNRTYYDFQYSVGSGTPSGDYVTYELDRPFYARYARLVSKEKEVCTDYTFGDTDLENAIEFHGSTASSDVMLQRVMFVLDDDVTTCMSLPTRNTTDTAKYYWANFDTTVLGATGNSSFNLQLTGSGLTCNNASGPQVTMVMFPKDSTTLKFKGRRKKCTFLEETTGLPMTCKYACACSDAITCADIGLVLYYNSNSESDQPYQLCDVKVVP